MLFHIGGQRFENVVKCVDPFNMFTIPVPDFSIRLDIATKPATYFSLYSLIIRLP